MRDKLWRELRHKALDEGKSASQIISDLVEQYLKAGKKGRKVRRTTPLCFVLSVCIALSASVVNAADWELWHYTPEPYSKDMWKQVEKELTEIQCRNKLPGVFCMAKGVHERKGAYLFEGYDGTFKALVFRNRAGDKQIYAYGCVPKGKDRRLYVFVERLLHRGRKGREK